MSDNYALLSINTNSKKLYKSRLTEDDKGKVFYCPKCKCEMIVAGIIVPLHFRAKNKHNEYNGGRCPNDTGDSLIIRDVEHDLKKMVNHVDENPTTNQIDEIRKKLKLNSPIDDSGDEPEIDDPSIIIFPGEEGIIDIEYFEDGGNENEVGDGYGSTEEPSEMNAELPELPPFKKVVTKNTDIAKLYNAIESGSKNDLIKTDEGDKSAYDLVVNYNTLSNVKKEGLSGYKLVHAYKLKTGNDGVYPLAIHSIIKQYTNNKYLLFRDDVLNKTDKDNKKRILYYLVRIENDVYNELFREAVFNKNTNNKSSHFLFFSNKWKKIENDRNYMLYETVLNSKTFKIIFKKRNYIIDDHNE